MRKIILIVLLLVTTVSFAQEKNISTRTGGKTSLPSIFGNTDKGKLNYQDNILKSDTKPGNRINTNNRGINNTTLTKQLQENKRAGQEPELYAKFIKQSGWFKGYGKPLTKEQASHYPFYYRFSEMNDAGHWTKIEAFDGYHRPTASHSMITYLVNQYDDSDSGVNEVWKERLKTICQWELIGDPKGKTVIQERAYDKDMNLIYCYSPVFIEKNKIAGNYTDSWGMPIKMRNDSITKGANYVYITYDKQGNEVLYEFMDEQGFRTKNKDGAYMTRKEYNKNGLQIKEISCNAIGDHTIDNWGNCGWSSEYDEIGNRISTCYRDDKWNPMRMPSNRGGEDNSVIKIKFTFDEYGREIKYEFLDEKDQKDKNQYGVHSITNRYNEKGQIIESSYRDINGNRIGSDSLNIAQVLRTYDKNGNETHFEIKDRNGNYINSSANCCKQIVVYDGNQLTSVQEYRAGRDSLSLTYDMQTYKDGRTVYKWFDKDICRIDSVDSHGNEVLREYYDLNGKPIMDGGYSKHYTLYKYDRDHTISYEFYTDTVNNYIVPEDQNWSIRLIALDSLSQTKLVTVYDNTSRVLSNVLMKLDKDCNNILSQTSLNDFGKPSRTYYEGVLYHKVRTSYNIYGNFSSFIGENEFGEPAYIIGNDVVYHYMRFASNGESYFCDENGNDIEDMEKFVENIPKAVCIQIIDTTGYTNLLKDGDILLKYGNWYYPDTCARYNENNDNELNLEMIFSAREDKDIWVLRHDAENKTSNILSLRLPEGTPSELGFTCHQICYTYKECERLETSLRAYLKQNKQHVNNLNPPAYPEEKKIVLALPSKSAYNNYVYREKGLKDPAILVAFENMSSNKTWIFGEESSKLENLITNHPNDKYILRNLYFTTNGSHIDSIESYVRVLGIKFREADISKANYERFTALVKKWKSDNPQKENSPYPTTIKEKADINKKKEYLSPKEVFKKFANTKDITTMSFNKQSGNLWKQLTEEAEIFNSAKEVYLIMCNENSPEATDTFQTVLGSLDKKKYQVLLQETNNWTILGKSKGKKYDQLIIFNDSQLFYILGNFRKDMLENPESFKNLLNQ